jgi:hypothetical protein
VKSKEVITKRLVIAVVIAAAVCISTPAVSAAPIVGIEPLRIDASHGDMFTVNVSVDPEGSPIMGAQYDLHFNTTLLNAINQTSGTFLGQDGIPTMELVNEIDNENGKIEYGVCRIGVDYGVSTPGVLAAITFHVIGESGVCELLLDDVALANPPPGGELPGFSISNATVAVTPESYTADLNGDGKITSADATIALLMSVRGECDHIADVNNDGYVTSLDALMIMQVADKGIEYEDE